MKHKIIVLAVLVTLALGVYSYFHVDGKEIETVSKISEACTATIAKYELLDWNGRVETTLNAAQIQELKALIESSSFTRVLANTVYHHSRDMYDIRIDFPDGTDPLILTAIGNEYISGVNQFNGKHLKIQNKNWQTELESILNQTP